MSRCPKHEVPPFTGKPEYSAASRNSPLGRHARHTHVRIDATHSIYPWGIRPQRYAPEASIMPGYEHLHVNQGLELPSTVPPKQPMPPDKLDQSSSRGAVKPSDDDRTPRHGLERGAHISDL